MFSTADLAKRYNVHRVTIFRWREQGLLPTPLMLGTTSVRWREADLHVFEKWLLDRANAEKAGNDPDSIPRPNYSLPVTTDSHSMSRERMAASFEEPSSMRSMIEELGDDMAKLAAEAAVIASQSLPGQLTEAAVNRLRDALPSEVKEQLLSELPPANAARLEEILS